LRRLERLAVEPGAVLAQLQPSACEPIDRLRIDPVFLLLNSR
jgi:hypothetical protein